MAHLKKVKLVIVDIANYQHLVQELIDVDFIVNCAASSSHPYSMRELSFNLDVNGRGVINILEAIKKSTRAPLLCMSVQQHHWHSALHTCR